jgi:hypothetical protein
MLVNDPVRQQFTASAYAFEDVEQDGVPAQSNSHGYSHENQNLYYVPALFE